MNIKRKFIDGSSWNFADSRLCGCIHVDDTYNGYVSLVKVIKAHKKITVDYEGSHECLVDTGYKCLIFLPDNEKWCAAAGYNGSNELIEWYFDMTKGSFVDEKSRPFYDDLFLDIAVSPEFKISILDEDELKEALESNIITESDYEMAYKTCEKVINEVIPNRDFMVAFFEKYLSLLD